MIDVTLAWENTNSKLFDVAPVADVDDEDRVGNSLLQIWNFAIESYIYETDFTLQKYHF